jgi:hypothetical protein
MADMYDLYIHPIQFVLYFFIHMVPINHVGDLYLVETKHKAYDSTY